MSTVFFDLDGTLTNPKEGITRCIQHALAELGHALPPVEELTWCIGPPLLQSFEKLVGTAQASAALGLYRQRFGDIGWQENHVYPGILELLEQVQAAGIVMHLATSKPHVYARRIVEHFEILPYLTQIFGSELDGTRTDKSELLQHALGSVTVDGAVSMVGDRHHDIIGARNNGLQAIGVSYGFGSRQELCDAGAHHIVGTPEDIRALLI